MNINFNNNQELSKAIVEAMDAISVMTRKAIENNGDRQEFVCLMAYCDGEGNIAIKGTGSQLAKLGLLEYLKETIKKDALNKL